MKYIIDLPDNCSWVQWVMTSDKDGHVYFDFKSPEDLTPLDKELSSELGEAYQKGFEAGQHEATTLEYQQGLDDAWEMAKRIALVKIDKNCPYFTVAELEKIFGCSTYQSVFDTYSAPEAIEKFQAYEQQKPDLIKVGDEVDYKGMTKYVVTGIVDDDTICGFSLNGLWNANTIKEVTKTGRHFPQMAELLKAMKEGAE